MKILPLVLISAVMVVSCGKPATTVNLSFRNKPLSFIQAAICGRWQLDHACGGITGTCSYDLADFLVVFGPDNSIIRTIDGLSTTGTIHWIRQTDTHGNWTYSMDAYDTSGYQYSWNPEGIYDDTLVITAYGIDGVEYFFSKAK
jgi:hypothetical protein